MRKVLIILGLFTLQLLFFLSIQATAECVGDIDKDGDVDGADVAAFAASFGLADCAACGDGNIDEPEICDDGNLDNGDNCNPTCNLSNTTTLFVGTPGSQGSGDIPATIGGAGELATDGTYLYYADLLNNLIRRILISTGLLETIAGSTTAGYEDDPIGLDARFSSPNSLTTDGTTLWVSDSQNYVIRAVSLSPPYAVTTVAGSGVQGYADDFGLSAQLDSTYGLTYYDGFVYFLDGAAATVRRFNPSTGEVTTLAGSPYITGTVDGYGSAARFSALAICASVTPPVRCLFPTQTDMLFAP